MVELALEIGPASLPPPAAHLWKTFRFNPNTIPVDEQNGSPSHRNRVHLQTGIAFTFNRIPHRSQMIAMPIFLRPAPFTMRASRTVERSRCTHRAEQSERRQTAPLCARCLQSLGFLGMTQNRYWARRKIQRWRGDLFLRAVDAACLR